jgi:hypothetical protein
MLSELRGLTVTEPALVKVVATASVALERVSESPVMEMLLTEAVPERETWMLPGWLMVTLSPGWGRALVLQFAGVFQEPVPPTQLTALKNRRFSRVSRQQRVCFLDWRREIFGREGDAVPVFTRPEPAPDENINNFQWSDLRKSVRRIPSTNHCRGLL